MWFCVRGLLNGHIKLPIFPKMSSNCLGYWRFGFLGSNPHRFDYFTFGNFWHSVMTWSDMWQENYNAVLLLEGRSSAVELLSVGGCDDQLLPILWFWCSTFHDHFIYITEPSYAAFWYKDVKLVTCLRHTFFFSFDWGLWYKNYLFCDVGVKPSMITSITICWAFQFWVWKNLTVWLKCVGRGSQ